MRKSEFIEDKWLLPAVIACVFNATSHWIMFFTQGYVVDAAVHASCATVGAILTVIFGRKVWNPMLFVWSLTILYFNRFNNFTSFILLLIAIGMNRRTKIPYLVAYSVAVLVCMAIYRDTYNQLIVHVTGCSFFYAVFSYIYDNLEQIKARQKLELTADEEKILNELSKGKQQKEIDFYSHVTVSKKMAEARKRNNCATNGELIHRFKNQLNKSTSN